jgi:hypothetical protein
MASIAHALAGQKARALRVYLRRRLDFSQQLLRKTRFVGPAWWAWEDSNLQPDLYEQASVALGIRAASR